MKLPFSLSAYTLLVLIGIIIALLIWLGVVNLHSLINDVLASFLAGIGGAYVLYLLIGKRRRK